MTHHFLIRMITKLNHSKISYSHDSEPLNGSNNFLFSWLRKFWELEIFLIHMISKIIKISFTRKNSYKMDPPVFLMALILKLAYLSVQFWHWDDLGYFIINDVKWSTWRYSSFIIHTQLITTCFSSSRKLSESLGLLGCISGWFFRLSQILVPVPEKIHFGSYG